jgi:hypothetical protein
MISEASLVYIFSKVTGSNISIVDGHWVLTLKFVDENVNAPYVDDSSIFSTWHSKKTSKL